MFSKIVVKGEDQAPLYKFLTDQKTDPKFAEDIDWNFAKFLINRKGEIVARFPAATKPTDPALMGAVEKALKEPKPDAGRKQPARSSYQTLYDLHGERPASCPTRPCWRLICTKVRQSAKKSGRFPHWETVLIFVSGF